jgi:hypothetical protein
MQHIPKFFLILLLFSSGLLFGQGYDLDITANDQTTLDFTQISIKKYSSGISGQREFFSASITKPDPNEEVRLYGEVSWQDVDKSSPEYMASFLTAPFSLNYITNQQLGNVIRIDDDKSNSSVVDRNISKGKLVGTYFLTFRLYKKNDPNRIPALSGVIPLASESKSFEVKNPTQTISIIEPMLGDMRDISENISIAWTQIEGVLGYGHNGNYSSPYYWVRANKLLPGETPDGALSRTSLYIDKKLENISGQTNTSWQMIKNKDWAAGDQIALMISAVFPGGLELKSAPVVFSVTDRSAHLADTTSGGNGNNFVLQDHPFNVALIAAINALPANIFASIPPLFIQSLTNGRLIISSISMDGAVYTIEQLQSLMDHLNANPSLILSIVLNSK